jgi:hypothetical protein
MNMQSTKNRSINYYGSADMIKGMDMDRNVLPFPEFLLRLAVKFLLRSLLFSQIGWTHISLLWSEF